MNVDLFKEMLKRAISRSTWWCFARVDFNEFEDVEILELIANAGLKYFDYKDDLISFNKKVYLLGADFDFAFFCKNVFDEIVSESLCRFSLNPDELDLKEEAVVCLALYLFYCENNDKYFDYRLFENLMGSKKFPLKELMLQCFRLKDELNI